jgi:hypothetical protein
MILSHVWADGFGNSKANTLPICRLKSFIEVFERLVRAQRALHAGDAPDRLQATIPFWIDTLAVPIGEKYKAERRLAIKNMHLTYTNAAYTVVLDAGLMAQERGSTYAETAMKITTSHWMTRLWTLQEAFLSKRLFFNFKDMLVDMDQLEHLRDESLASSVPLAAQSYYRALLGPERRNRNIEQNLSINTSLLASLWKAVQWRTTSHRQHETLALATLLRLNTDHFYDSEIVPANQSEAIQARLDEKMQSLLNLIALASERAIPAGLIFLPGPRLSAKGYGWAPKTWMTGQNSEHLDLLSSSQLGAELKEEGLLVRCPGFRLHRVGSHGGPIKRQFVFPSDSLLRDWLSVSDADPEPIQAPLDKSLAIITMSQKMRTAPQIALLVAIHRVEGRTLYVRIVKRVWICTETKPSRIDLLQKMFRATMSQAICGESLTSEQKWCVDGPECENPEPSIYWYRRFFAMRKSKS